MSDLNFILQNSEKFKILIQKDFILKSFFHASIFMKDFPEVIGTGSGESDVWALKKAISELEERLTFKNLAEKNPDLKNSSGFAAHSVLEFAKRNAMWELIERDMFLSNWLVKKSPVWLSSNEKYIKNGEIIQNYINIFEKFSYELKVGVIGISNNVWVTTATIKPIKNISSFGLVVSAGAHEILELSLVRSIEDQLRMVAILETRNKNNNKIFEVISKDQVLKPEAHLEFYLNPENSKEIDWYFNTTNDAVVADDLNVEFEEFKMGNIDPSLFVVKCNSNDAQLYFNGKTTSKFINAKRLKSFSKINDYNYQLHPLG